MASVLRVVRSRTPPTPQRKSMPSTEDRDGSRRCFHLGPAVPCPYRVKKNLQP
jgi:hypothetical protein